MEARGTPECSPIWTWTIGDRDDQLRDGQLNDQPKATDFSLEPQLPSYWPHQPQSWQSTG
jgi:hypothetical protein